jgi:hypothetical protein
MIKQKNQERREAWRQRWYDYYGRWPTEEEYAVNPCRGCSKPVWRPVKLNIKPEQFFCAGIKCTNQMLKEIDRRREERNESHR